MCYRCQFDRGNYRSLFSTSPQWEPLGRWLFIHARRLLGSHCCRVHPVFTCLILSNLCNRHFSARGRIQPHLPGSPVTQFNKIISQSIHRLHDPLAGSRLRIGILHLELTHSPPSSHCPCPIPVSHPAQRGHPVCSVYSRRIHLMEYIHRRRARFNRRLLDIRSPHPISHPCHLNPSAPSKIIGQSSNQPQIVGFPLK